MVISYLRFGGADWTVRPGVVFNEQCSLPISGLGSLSVPHKHVKYLMQGLIEVEVHNVVFFSGCYQSEKSEVFQHTRKCI